MCACAQRSSTNEHTPCLDHPSSLEGVPGQTGPDEEGSCGPSTPHGHQLAHIVVFGVTSRVGGGAVQGGRKGGHNHPWLTQPHQTHRDDRSNCRQAGHTGQPGRQYPLAPATSFPKIPLPMKQRFQTYLLMAVGQGPPTAAASATAADKRHARNIPKQKNGVVGEWSLPRVATRVWSELPAHSPATLPRRPRQISAAPKGSYCIAREGGKRTGACWWAGHMHLEQQAQGKEEVSS
jgi:hypothetical protein